MLEDSLRAHYERGFRRLESYEANFSKGWKMTLAEAIREKALAIGFDAVGFSRAMASPRAEHFEKWLANGMNAGMAWLGRDPARRTNPENVLPGVKTIVSVGLSYHVADPSPEIWNDPSRGRVARYAWGRDYHDVMLPMLNELAEFIRSESQIANHRSQSSDPIPHQPSPISYVDTGALLEREIAERAGIGFIGKNTLVLSPEFGSTLLLGEVLVAEEIPFAHDPTPRGTCGSCTRCQTACPTHAFPAPYVLDSRLCISYLTIENKGAIPEPLRRKMGQWIFGCDDCQTVCPWVKQFRKPGRQRFLSFDPDFAAPKLSELLALDDAAFKSRFVGTPLLRPKRRGLLRNVCVALGNGLDQLSRVECRAALEALERASADAEPLVREHAAWALGRATGV